MSNHTTMPAALAAIEDAIKVAMSVPEVDPIFMLDDSDVELYDADPYEITGNIDAADIVVACPTCKRLTEIVEISYGDVGHTEASVDEQGDGDFVIFPGDDDNRDRHTLAFACHWADCQQPFNTDNFRIEWM